MKKQLKIGGMSLPNCIIFFGKKHTVKIEKDGKYVISKTNTPKFEKIIGDVPFIRGAYFYLKLLLMIIKPILSWFIEKPYRLIVFLTTLALYMFTTPKETAATTMPLYIQSIFYAIVIGFFMFFIYLIRKHHAIEHKLISTVTNNLPLTISNIRKQSKENRRCGGVLVPYLFAFTYVWQYLNLPKFYTLENIPMFAIAFEFFAIAQIPKVGDVFYYPGYLIQKVTTSDNFTDEQLKSFIPGFKAFIKKEAE